MIRSDTIVAVSTPLGVGGIAVIRLSGPAALETALPHLSVAALQPRYATYCRFDDVDDGIAVYYPVGYTGEPTVEYSCHGSLYVQRAIVEALVASGARMAERGEFTLRAVRNGRLDLSQAEAVADLIDAVTPAQHRLAIGQLRGGYAQKLKELRQQLLDLTSLLELELDFSQEDVEFADRHELRLLLSQISAHVKRLIDSFSTGNALKEGIPVAIVGEPNVGKSTLLNALLDDDRAIVSPVPGTTRDTVEEMLVIGGVAFRLIDTAGLRSTADQVEALGIERSRRAMERAHVVIEVTDASQNSSLSIIHSLPDSHIIHVVNKSDLLPSPPAGNSDVLYISALSGEGISELRQALLHTVGNINVSDVLMSNPRHYQALQLMQQALDRAQEGLDTGMPADLVVVDLRDALYNLGTVTGQVTNDQVLDNIFSRFCIGK